MAASFQRIPAPPKHRSDRPPIPAETPAEVPTFPPMKASSRSAYTAPPLRLAKPQRIEGTSGAYRERNKSEASPPARATKQATIPDPCCPLSSQSKPRSFHLCSPSKAVARNSYPHSNIPNSPHPALKSWCNRGAIHPPSPENAKISHKTKRVRFPPPVWLGAWFVGFWGVGFFRFCGFSCEMWCKLV